MSETEKFLRDLFEYKPDDAWILLWTLEGERSRWFQDIPRAARSVEKLREANNVYVQLGISPEAFGPKQRCTADSVIGIPGLWLDLDYGTDGHEKTNLPPRQEDAEALLAEAEYRPTLVVNSGHGLHAYWLFKEPWLFDSVEERQRAAGVLRGWAAWFKQRSRERGWGMDGTADLARILRVPGSFNLKGEPTLVRIIANGGPRFNPSDFDEYVLLEEGAAATEVGELVIDADAVPPLRKFRNLESYSRKFKLSLRRSRSDLQDQSPSAYDLSLASIAARDGWTDQEIVNLIIYARAENSEDVKKAMRRDYLVSTLQKARKDIAQEDAVSELSRSDAAVASPEHLRELLQNALGVSVRQVREYTGEQPVYTLEAEEGVVKLGGVQGITEQSRLRNAIAAGFHLAIPAFRPGVWRSISQALLSLTIREDTGVEATDCGRVAHWLETYLADCQPVPRTNESVLGRLPYRERGAVWLFAGEFLSHISRRHQEHISLQELCQLLKRYGADRDQVGVDVDGKRSTRAVWSVPEGDEAAAT